MNIIITTFNNPFSFFCMLEHDGDGKDIDFVQNCDEQSKVYSNKIDVTDVCHGQYVAVMWKNKWARGLVTMESQFLIWLIDYGFYFRPNDKTVYISLPPAFKKLPTKVFEASIHGVVPVDIALTDECQMKNEITMTWTPGAIEKAQKLIASAPKIYFVPVALMSTKGNDVVIGDLYLEMRKKLINIVDELEQWPVFLEKNKDAYIKCLWAHYTSRKKHRACLLKPAIVDSELPTMTLDTTLEQYDAICAAAPQLDESFECSATSLDGSTVVEFGSKKAQDIYQLTAAEVEEYSNTYIMVNGRKYNMLNVLINKLKDLNMCERYKNHDLKATGRASYRIPPVPRSPHFNGSFRFE